jgi:hypothetical protein
MQLRTMVAEPSLTLTPRSWALVIRVEAIRLSAAACSTLMPSPHVGPSTTHCSTVLSAAPDPTKAMVSRCKVSLPAAPHVSGSGTSTRLPSKTIPRNTLPAPVTRRSAMGRAPTDHTTAPGRASPSRPSTTTSSPPRQIAVPPPSHAPDRSMVCGSPAPGKTSRANVTRARPPAAVNAAAASSAARNPPGLASGAVVETTNVRAYTDQRSGFSSSLAAPAASTVRWACVCGSEPGTLTDRRWIHAPGRRFGTVPHTPMPAAQVKCLE